LVPERSGLCLGGAQMLDDALMLAERLERAAQVESHVDRLLQSFLSFRQVLQRHKRLLEARGRFAIRAAGGRLRARLAQEAHRPLPLLAADGVVRQPLDMFRKPIRIKPQHGAHDPLVQRSPPLGEQAAIGNFVGERVLEGGLAVREQAGLVQKLVLLEIGQPPMQRVLRQPGDGVQDRVGNVLTDHRGGLQELLVGGWQTVDPRRENCLHRGRDLEGLEGADKAIGPSRALE
jgi:hypothetical protein